MLIEEQLIYVYSRDPILSLLSEGLQTPAVVRTGVYEVGHFGSSHFLGPGYEHYPALEDENGDMLGMYGVCDDVADILRVYPMLETSPRQFVVTMKKVKRDLSNKGHGGGWRWHKWGEYIGRQEPTTEYLDDEPLIEQVYVFHIYERRGPLTPPSRY